MIALNCTFKCDITVSGKDAGDRSHISDNCTVPASLPQSSINTYGTAEASDYNGTSADGNHDQYQ